MRKFAFLLLLLAGCNQPVEPFTGTCTIVKVDGRVTSVKVILPNPVRSNGSITYECTTREEVDRMITNLGAIAFDLTQVRDQMPVVEPKTPKN